MQARGRDRCTGGVKMSRRERVSWAGWARPEILRGRPESPPPHAGLPEANPRRPSPSGRTRTAMARRAWFWPADATILVFSLFGGSLAWVMLYSPRIELDNAINNSSWRPNADVTDIAVPRRPNDYIGAVMALLGLGFRGRRGDLSAAAGSGLQRRERH